MPQDATKAEQRPQATPDPLEQTRRRIEREQTITREIADAQEKLGALQDARDRIELVGVYARRLNVDAGAFIPPLAEAVLAGTLTELELARLALADRRIHPAALDYEGLKAFFIELGKAVFR